MYLQLWVQSTYILSLPKLYGLQIKSMNLPLSLLSFYLSVFLVCISVVWTWLDNFHHHHRHLHKQQVSQIQHLYSISSIKKINMKQVSIYAHMYEYVPLLLFSLLLFHRRHKINCEKRKPTHFKFALACCTNYFTCHCTALHETEYHFQQILYLYSMQNY